MNNVRIQQRGVSDAMRSVRVWGAMVREGFSFTVHYMRTNRFRTFLSLLGVAVGIFTIMAILVMVHTLKTNIMKELGRLDSRSLYISGWPWYFDGTDEEWRAFRNNKAPDYYDFRALQRMGEGFGTVAMVGTLSKRVIKRDQLTVDDARLCGVLPNFESLIDLTVEQGRAFSFRELTGNLNICLLGSTVTKNLFGDADPIGEEVRVDGFRLKVVGVLKEQGNRMFTRSADNSVVVPYGFASKQYGWRSLSSDVAVTPAAGVSEHAIEGEVRRILRANRKIAPGNPDNFALNKLSSIARSMDKTISALNMTAIFLGGFSVLIGAFGIANIMLVSVQERIRIIGIQKALGAHSKFILLQFLIEAILLSLLGGVLALVLLWTFSASVSLFTSSDVAMRWWHGALGCGLAVVVGLMSGLLPARRAAMLQPVVAIEGLSSAH